MLITEEQFQQSPTLRGEVKTWVAKMNSVARSSQSITFKLAARSHLSARPRRSGLGPSRQGLAFFPEGEEFRLSSVVTDSSPAAGTFEISAIFNPVDLKTVAEYSSISMTLDCAMAELVGFEEWSKAPSPPEIVDAGDGIRNKIPSVAEARSSEVWGAW